MVAPDLGLALSSKRGVIHLQIVALEDPDISWDSIPQLDLYYVPCNQLAGWNQFKLPVSEALAHWRDEVLESIHNRLGFAGLQETEGSCEKDNKNQNDRQGKVGGVRGVHSIQCEAKCGADPENN